MNEFKEAFLESFSPELFGCLAAFLALALAGTALVVGLLWLGFKVWS